MKISEVRARKAVRMAAEEDRRRSMSADARALHDQNEKSRRAHNTAKLQRQRLKRMAADSGKPVTESLNDEQLAARAIGTLIESEGAGMRGNPGEAPEAELTPEERKAADSYFRETHGVSMDDVDLLAGAVRISNLTPEDAKAIGDRWDNEP